MSAPKGPSGTIQTTEIEYAIESAIGLFKMPGKDLAHAKGMMRSTSVVIGPMRGRRLVQRTVITTPWEEVEE